MHDPKSPKRSVTAPVSHQKQPEQTKTNTIEIERKPSKINEPDRNSAAHSGLVAGRVLPGPPAFAGFASYGSASHLVAKAAPPKPTVEVKRVRRSSNEVRAETDRHPAEPPHPGSIVSWPLIHGYDPLLPKVEWKRVPDISNLCQGVAYKKDEAVAPAPELTAGRVLLGSLPDCGDHLWET